VAALEADPRDRLAMALAALGRAMDEFDGVHLLLRNTAQLSL